MLKFLYTRFNFSVGERIYSWQEPSKEASRLLAPTRLGMAETSTLQLAAKVAKLAAAVDLQLTANWQV